MVLQGYYAMGKTPVKHTLAGYIIKKTDTEGYRSGKLTGEKHLNKITEMMEFVGGRRKLIDQARFIENNTQAGHDGKIRINWTQVNSDIKKIDCDVSSIPELCRIEGVEDSRAKQLRLIESVKQWKSEVGDCDWICRYYDDILGRLKAGKSVTEADEDMRFKCINAITRIKEPVWERVFSANVFKDSKKFEKCYRQKMVSILICALALMVGHIQAQEVELTKEEKKALQEKIDSIQHAEAVEAINAKKFTLEADQVVFKYGQTAYVTSNTNFVSVDGEDAVVQVAFNIPAAGLGGVTVNGKVSSYEMRTDKRGTLYLSMNVMGVGISARLDISMPKGTNNATVTITPNFNSNRLTLNGVILPAFKSSVFKGRSI